MKRRWLLLCLWLLVISPLTAQVRWNAVLKQPADWFASTEAANIARNTLLYQHASGGWPKNVDMSVAPTAAQQSETSFSQPTIDNGATTTQLEFLARVHTARSDPKLQEAVERGLDYLLAAQSVSGGWPQYFPLRAGYYSHVTYNDNAMANVLGILRTTARGEMPFSWVDADRRIRAAAAVDRGITCIVRTQVVQDGQPTVWCAQHDESTLAPAWARNFEPPSLSGFESVSLVRILMQIEKPSPEIVAAIEGAVAWLSRHSISGLRIETSTTVEGERDRVTVADPAAPALWARFYELGTNRPIYIGRDRIIHYQHNQIERERRAGYNYLGNWPAELIGKSHPRWKAKLSLK